MPTTTQDQEALEPPPKPGGTTLAAECFPPGQRKQEQRFREGVARTQDASEAELLGLMGDQLRNPGTAREAWAELHGRHSRYIFTVVARAFGGALGDKERISDVVVDTLQTAFDWAGKQPSPEQLVARFADQDPDGVRRRVLGWLSVVARRIAAHRIASDVDAPGELLGDLPAPEQDADDEPPLALRSLLRDALGKLSKKETEALQVSLPWYEPETGEFSFPRGEAARIAASLRTTPGAFRQSRHRSMKRLRGLLESSGSVGRDRS